MPTAFTAQMYLNQETSFRDFLLRCTLKFEGLPSLFNDPATEVYDHLTVDAKVHVDYVKARIHELRNSTDEEILSKFQKAAKELAQWRLDQAVLQNEAFDRYTATLAEAKSWIPPGDEYLELKEFMIEQLETSIGKDCPEGRIDLEPLKDAVEGTSESIDVASYRKEMLLKAEAQLEEELAILGECEQKLAAKKKWTMGLSDSLVTVG